MPSSSSLAENERVFVLLLFLMFDLTALWNRRHNNNQNQIIINHFHQNIINKLRLSVRYCISIRLLSFI